MRPLCKQCQTRPVAVNYHKNDRVFYRSQCDHCVRGYEAAKPNWQRAGYNKKSQCDRCNFKSPHTEVFNVFHVDGDLTNVRYSNLKTVCANCQRVLHKDGVRWRQGDLLPDL